MCFFLPVDAQLLSLTSSPQLNGPICPGPIEFTCVGTQVPLFLDWRLNDTIYGTYLYRNDTTPLNITLDPLLPGVMAQVINVSLNSNVTMNITSTLNGSASILEGSSFQCKSSNFISTSHIVNVRGKNNY